jgi:hypothetical protein
MGVSKIVSVMLFAALLLLTNIQPKASHADDATDTMLYTIGNRVWNDANNNGIEDTNELGVIGAELRLYDSSGVQLLAVTRTDTLGYYQFARLQAGKYVVEVIPPDGFVSSTGKNGDLSGPFEPAPDGSNFADKSDKGTYFNPTSIRSSVIDVASANATILNFIDFGIYQPFSIGNRVWHDYNNNGLMDSGDGLTPGIDDVLVQLYDASRQVIVAKAVSANGGYYRFDSLIEGNYVVEIPASNFNGGVLTTYMSSDITENDPNRDVDVNDNGINTGNALATGIRSGVIIIGTDRTPREPVSEYDIGLGYQGTPIDRRGNMTLDFGFFRTATIGDRVWNDLNVNGLQDEGEPGLPNVAVILNSQKYGSQTVVTDANGHYTFTNLIPGEKYQVIFGAASGYVRTMVVSNINDELDNDADESGLSKWVTLRSGEDMTMLDAGYHLPNVGASTLVSNTNENETKPTVSAPSEAISVVAAPTAIPTTVPIEARALAGDWVWEDINRNGVQDLGEPGLANVLVTAYSPDGTVFQTIRTNANGRYSFAGLLPYTTYTLTFQLPQGYMFTVANANTDELDSDADPNTGLIRGLVLWPGEVNNAIDVGAYDPQRINAQTPLNRVITTTAVLRQQNAVGEQVANTLPSSPSVPRVAPVNTNPTRVFPAVVRSNVIRVAPPIAVPRSSPSIPVKPSAVRPNQLPHTNTRPPEINRPSSPPVSQSQFGGSRSVLVLIPP